jgi:hypothetical protein
MIRQRSFDLEEVDRLAQQLRSFEVVEQRTEPW